MEEMKLTRFNSQNVKRFVHYRIAFLVLIKANWSKKKKSWLNGAKITSKFEENKMLSFQEHSSLGWWRKRRRRNVFSANINHLSTQDMRQKSVIWGRQWWKRKLIKTICGSNICGTWNVSNKEASFKLWNATEKPQKWSFHSQVRHPEKWAI